jgi:hypothetical protein
MQEMKIFVLENLKEKSFGGISLYVRIILVQTRPRAVDFYG